MLNYKTSMGLMCASVLLSSLLLGNATVGANNAYAQDASAQTKKASERKTKRTPAMRSRVYDQLARAQKYGDDGDTQKAIETLNEVKAKSSSMNSYELAMMHNFYGFVYYNAEDYDNAIAAFEKVVEQQPIPETFEQSTLFSLAQLHMMRGNYDETITFLERWESLQSGELPAKNLVLKAQAMYQKKDYKKASTYINEAIVQVENSDLGFQVDENWYVLQRAIYFELKEPQQVANVLLKMVRLFNEPKYWLQLAGMYGELGEEEKQLAVMEAAYQQGYVRSGAEMFNLAQLYYYHEMPFKAAAIMEQGLNEGKMEENLQNLKFLSQSWSLAKENDKAIPVMLAAAELSSDGELDAQLGQIYLNMEKWSEAVAAADKAISKGGLRNQGTAHLVMGMAYFNLGEYQHSIEQLSQAQQYESSRGMAKQWEKYIQKERSNYALLNVDKPVSDS